MIYLFYLKLDEIREMNIKNLKMINIKYFASFQYTQKTEYYAHIRVILTCDIS